MIADDIPGYDIRYARVEDGEVLKQWLLLPEILYGCPMNNPPEVEQATGAWMSYVPYKAGLTATIHGVPCGMGQLFLMPYRKVAHQALVKVIVDPAHWRKGVGSSLLRNLKHHAKHFFNLKLLYSEIYGERPLFALLCKEGFTVFAEQKQFIKFPDGSYEKRILLEVLL